LTARGPTNAGELYGGLDLGRETIVRAFASLVTDEANKYWGKKDAG
jgi:hypothetical protein